MFTDQDLVISPSTITTALNCLHPLRAYTQSILPKWHTWAGALATSAICTPMHWLLFLLHRTKMIIGLSIHDNYIVSACCWRLRSDGSTYTLIVQVSKETHCSPCNHLCMWVIFTLAVNYSTTPLDNYIPSRLHNSICWDTPIEHTHTNYYDSNIKQFNLLRHTYWAQYTHTNY